MHRDLITFVGAAPTIGDTGIGQGILQGLRARCPHRWRVYSDNAEVFAALPEIRGDDEVLGRLPYVAVPRPTDRSFLWRYPRLLNACRRSGGRGVLDESTLAAWRGAFEGSAALVLQGGPSLTDPWFDTEDMLRQRVVLALARYYGVPVFALGVGCGPFTWGWPRRAWNRPIARRVLRGFESIVARDAASASALRAMGLPPSKAVASTDAAVFLEPRHDERFASVARRIDAARRPRIAVCTRDYQSRYGIPPTERAGILGRLARLLDSVQERVGDVFFLCTDHLVREDKETDNDVAAEVLAQMTRPGAQIIADDVANPAMLKALYGLFDAMFTMRLHPAIFAMGMGVPCQVLSYDRKCDEFFKQVGCAEDSIGIDRFDPAASFRRVASFVADPGHRERVLAGFDSLRRRHAGDWDAVYDAINGLPGSASSNASSSD